MAGDIIVLRPQPGADETVAALAAAGFRARALPVLERCPLAETAAARARVQALAEYRVVVFVSPAAAEFGMAWIDRHWPQYPVGIAWVAVGEGTRRVLQRFGVPAVAPVVDERSEGMLELPELADVRHAKVLVMRGRGGRELLAETLRERGAQVDLLELYERQVLAVELPPADAVCAAVVSSVAVLEALIANNGLIWSRRPLIVPSPRVAAAARAAGFAEVVEARAAGPDATVAAVRTLEAGEHG